MLCLIRLTRQLLPLDSGDWAAVGVWAGVFVSAAAVVAAGLLLRHELEGRRIDVERYADERRAETVRLQHEAAIQARLLIGEMGRRAPSSTGSAVAATIDLAIDVSNHSDSFVLDIIVRIPGTNVRRFAPFVKPGQTESVEFLALPSDYMQKNVGCGGPYTTTELRVMLEFTDSSGRRWRRGGWEQPQPLPARLADSGLYAGIPPFPLPSHPYDQALDELGYNV